MVEDFSRPIRQQQPTKIRGIAKSKEVWKPLVERWLVVNIDAAFSSEKAAGALIARNSKRDVMFTASKMFEPMTAELIDFRTLKWAPEVATTKNWPRMEWRCDALRVINQVQRGTYPCIWDSWDLVWGIRSLLAGRIWSLVWTPREANLDANKAPKFVVKSNVEFCFDLGSAEGIPLVFLFSV